MAFNGYAYLLLLFPAVIVYWLLPHRLRAGYLLLASFAYYGSWNAVHALLPAGICLVAWLCGRRMLAEPARQGVWLRVGIATVLVVLAVFKYRDWMWANLDAVLGAAGLGPLPKIIQLALPLGLSFYTFEAISFLIDSKQGRVKKAGLLDLGLFVTFWPHLMAGPLVRVRELVPQFSQEKKLDVAMVVGGLDRLVLGLVMKNVFANSLAGLVDEGFLANAEQSNTFLDNWTLAFAFGLQIYFDFAGYSNMAIGAARLLGINLPENFRFPYHAANPSDFWSRWHMTLSRWIRDYLFFPINARFQGAPGPLYASLIGIMTLVGLWHGAGWGFMIWGTLHGVWLVLFRIWEKKAEGKAWAAAAPARLGWKAFTLAVVMLSWIPFRASSLAQAVTMMKAMVTGLSLRPSYSVNFYVVTAVLSVYVLVEPRLAALFNKVDARLSRTAPGLAFVRYLVRPVLYAIGLLMFVTFDDTDTGFIYFQF